MDDIAIGDVFANTTGSYEVVDLSPTRVRLRTNRTRYWVTRMAFAKWLRLDGGRWVRTVLPPLRQQMLRQAVTAVAAKWPQL